MNIESIGFTHLLNSEHLSLGQKIVVIFKKYLPAMLELQQLINKYELLITTEARAYEVLKLSTFTEQKTAADIARDNAARQLLRTVRSFEFSDDASEVAAANLLYDDLLKQIPAIVDEANERETVNLANLIARLREEPYAQAIALLGAGNLVQKAADKNAAFKAISTQQTTTDSAKDSGNMNAVRKPADEVLRKIFRAVESRFDLETADDQVKACVNEMNYDIKEANTKMKLRIARNNKKNNGDDPEKPAS